MSRSLPADVAAQVRPIPETFTPEFEDKGSHVRWSDSLSVAGMPVPVELGYSRAGGRADEAKERDNLRASAWQAMELARLGRRDLLAYCVVGRARNR